MPDGWVRPASESGAVFSEGRVYRYALWRCWNRERPLVVIGLNPSTADEVRDDPTIRRCKDFAIRERCGGIVILNLFAVRATLPGDMEAHPEPVGPDNDEALAFYGGLGKLVVAAWGVHGVHRGRSAEVARLLSPLHCFGRTNDGDPRHPLYLPRDAPISPWP